MCLVLCVLTSFLSPVCARQAPAGSRGPRPTEQTPPSLIDWWENNRADGGLWVWTDGQAEAGGTRGDWLTSWRAVMGLRIVQFHNWYVAAAGRLSIWSLYGLKKTTRRRFNLMWPWVKSYIYLKGPCSVIDQVGWVFQGSPRFMGLQSMSRIMSLSVLVWK